MWNLSFPTRNQTFTPCRVLTTGLQGSPVVILRRFFLSSGTGVLGRRGHRCPGRTPIDWSWFQLCFSQKWSLWPRRSTLGLCSYLQLQGQEGDALKIQQIRKALCRLWVTIRECLLDISAVASPCEAGQTLTMPCVLWLLGELTLQWDKIIRNWFLGF